MRAAESENALRKGLANPIDQMTARDGVIAMCRFYADERVDGAATDSERDMLLFQWGIDTFNAPDVLQLSITRQINVIGESQPYQLALTFSYKPTTALQKVDVGNQWCPTPADLPAFKQFVEASQAFQATADAKADRVELRLERRG